MERACVRNYEPVSEGVPQVNEAQTLDAQRAVVQLGGSGGSRQLCLARQPPSGTARGVPHRVTRRAVIVALAVGALAATVVHQSAGQGVPQLDRFNGFESGGAGDYVVGAGSPAGSVFHRVDAAGRFGLETAAAAGSSEYLEATLSAPTACSPTAIWACVESAPAVPRRIRSWMSGEDVVVEMLHRPRPPGAAAASTANRRAGQRATRRFCPDFSSMLFQYRTRQRRAR